MKPQDVIVAIKLADSDRWLGYAQYSKELGMSMSQIHSALRRLDAAGLYGDVNHLIRKHDFVSFLTHGLRYVFPARQEQITRGFPTAWASPALLGTPLASIAASDPPPVWPHPEGTMKGAAVAPLHPSAFHLMQDKSSYAILAAIDALRIGRARERDMAERELRKRLLDERV